MRNYTLQILKVGEFKIGMTHGHQVSQLARSHSHQKDTLLLELFCTHLKDRCNKDLSHTLRTPAQLAGSLAWFLC